MAAQHDSYALKEGALDQNYDEDYHSYLAKSTRSWRTGTITICIGFRRCYLTKFEFENQLARASTITREVTSRRRPIVDVMALVHNFCMI